MFAQLVLLYSLLCRHHIATNEGATLVATCRLMPRLMKLEVRLANRGNRAVVLCRTREMFRTKVLLKDGSDASDEINVYANTEFAPASLSSWTVLKPDDELTFRIGLIVNNENIKDKDVLSVKLRYVFSDPAGVYKLVRDQYGTESQKKVGFQSEIYSSEGIPIVGSFECEWRR